MLTQTRRDAEETTSDEQAEAILVAFRAEYGTVAGGRHRSASSSHLGRVSYTHLKTAAAVVLGTGMLLTGGVAAAATGSLPGAVQDRVRDMLSHVGVSVPGSDDHSAGHTDQSGSSEESGRSGSAGDEHRGHGGALSELAKSTDSRGVEHGSEVSGYASDGHSHTGEHGKAEPQQHPEQSKKARVETPNKYGEDHPDNSNSQQPRPGGHAGSNRGQ